MKTIIIDISKGIRKLDPNQSYPISLEHVYNNQLVIDWHINECNKLGISDYIYIGGYHIEKMIYKYPFLDYHFENNFMEKLKGIHDVLNTIDDDCIIIHSNILFKLDALKKIVSGQCAISIGVNEYCIDDNFKRIKFSINEKSYYYNGIMYISKTILKDVVNAMESDLNINPNLTFLEWINLLDKKDKFPKNYYIINSNSVNIRNRVELSKFILGTKAQTLENLRGLVKKSVILDQVSFTVQEWKSDKDLVYKRIFEKYKNKNIVIRSSSLNEDSWIRSNAGQFESFLNIEGNNSNDVIRCIDSVIESYKDNILENQILIQEYISSNIMSGVIFTRDIDNGAPYYIINYDDEGKYTDTVTGGKGKNIKTKIILRGNDLNVDDRTYMVINAVKEIEELVGHDGLDIEFVLGNEELYVVQVRPIVSYANKLVLTDDDIINELDSVKKYILCQFEEKPFLYGSTTVLGNMPDWNPAELIGSCPRQLALTVYQKLITNDVWAQARSIIGYKNINMEPLVLSITGRPYVDVRKSLNSFLPNDLNDDLSEKLVNFQLKKLKSNPEFHDKIEFKIAKTCMDFSFNEYKQELLNESFSNEEVFQFEKSLRELTNNIIISFNSSIDIQYDKLKILSSKRQEILKYAEKNMNNIPVIINKLISDCMDYGTLPFSILARHAFIAMTFLTSFKENKIFSNNEYDDFLSSMPTVATEIKLEIQSLKNNRISRSEFTSKYGHLRPNTYDITSLNYNEGFDVYFHNVNIKKDEEFHETIEGYHNEVFKAKSSVINNYLKNHKFKFTSEILKEFIIRSIPAREYAKFEFTKNIDLILQLIRLFGELLDLSREQMSYIPIESILKLATNSPSYSLRKELLRESEYNKKKYMLSQSIKLPNVICSVKDVEQFDLYDSLPNFITNKRVISNINDLNNGLGKDIDGKIILIESADPGYDWIFGFNIDGLITKYGGVASHMSIRCAEFGIPAAIGCGDLIYNNIKHNDTIELNCEGKYIRVIK